MRRYSYYFVKLSHSKLAPRDTNNHNHNNNNNSHAVWKDVAIVLAVFTLMVVLAIIYRRAKRLLRERKQKSRGQGSHFRSQTLRKKRDPPSNEVDYMYGAYSPFDDANETESVYSRYANMPAKPLRAYGSRSSTTHSGDEAPHGQHNIGYASPGIQQQAHFRSADDCDGKPF